MDIFEASKVGDLARINYLINQGIDINSQDPSGNTPLMIACENNHLAIVQSFRNIPGINVNVQNTFMQSSALIKACQYNLSDDIVKELLQFPNIDINLGDVNNKTPLMHSIYESHYLITRLLIENPNIDVNRYTTRGNTALMIACEYDNINVVRLLLAHPDIDTNRIDYDDKSAIDYLTESRNTLIDIIQELVNRGAVAPPAYPAPPVAGARAPEPFIDIPDGVDARLRFRKLQESAEFAKRFECKVCMTNSVNTRLNPCSHLLCSDCYARLPDPKTCPICRAQPVTDEPILYGGSNNYFNKLKKYNNKLK
jgi:hypothetical protein